MNKEEELRTLPRIGQILLNSAPPEWERIECTVAMVGDMGEIWKKAIATDGSESHFSTPIELTSSFQDLRSAMLTPGKGTWFSANYQLTPPSSFSVTYNFDQEVVFSDPKPDAVDYYEDLQEYPRDSENIPEWLQGKIVEARRMINSPRTE